MGESWSDLAAVEYLNEYGFVPVAGENPFAVGPYVTGDKRGRHPQLRHEREPAQLLRRRLRPHRPAGARGRRDLERDQLRDPGGVDRAVRRRRPGAKGRSCCATARRRSTPCPGNRRWIQLMFDAWLLMAPATSSMLDARDAMLAADLMRFGGANQDLLWNVFAARGLGEDASSAGPTDGDPKPSFASPYGDEGTVTFAPVGRGRRPAARSFRRRVRGPRSTPVADTDPGDAAGRERRDRPGHVRAAGRGRWLRHARFTVDVRGRAGRDLPINMPRQPGVRRARRDRDRRRREPGQADRRHRGDELGVARRRRSGQAGHGPARPDAGDAAGAAGPGERAAAADEPGDQGDPGCQSRFSALRSSSCWPARRRPASTAPTTRDFESVYTQPG